MPKKPRITSPGESQKVVEASGRVIHPPEHMTLSDSELAEFNKIISEANKSFWTDHNVTVAAMLAQVLTSVTLDPLQKDAKRKIDSVLSLRRSLGLHAIAQHGNARDMGKRVGIAKGIESKIDDQISNQAEKNDLISWPSS